MICEQITRQLEYQPPSAYVAEHVRYTYGCPQGREGELIVTSEKPPTANEKGVFGPRKGKPHGKQEVINI